MKKQNVVILGSTGTIGLNTLKVIDQFPDAFNVFCLTAYNNVDLLEQQIKKYHPKYVAVQPSGMEHIKRNGRLSGVKLFDVNSSLE